MNKCIKLDEGDHKKSAEFKKYIETDLISKVRLSGSGRNGHGG